MAKRYIKSIIYSLENIKISFALSQNPQDFGKERKPDPAEQGLDQEAGLSKNFEFEKVGITPGAGFEPATSALTARRSATELPRIN